MVTLRNGQCYKAASKTLAESLFSVLVYDRITLPNFNMRERLPKVISVQVITCPFDRHR